MSDFFFKLPESNPFSTRFTAPGKTPFFFDGPFWLQLRASHPTKFEDFLRHAVGLGEDIRTSVCLQYLVDSFETKSCRGQIVGRHGTGKSTLLAALHKSLVKKGYEIFSWTLHDQQRFLPDVFWLELQRFLQLQPNFLPTKCLLPPPVASRADYLAEQRASLVRDFGPGIIDELDGVRKPRAEEFRVQEEPQPEPPADLAPEKSWSEEDSNALNDAEPQPAPKRRGVLGFNASGNFGLLRSKDEAASPNQLGSQVKFDPFPGVAQGNESASEDGEEEEFDDIRLDSADPAQPKLEIPLGGEFAYHKERSFFDKKVVFFDGFEQLSYFNRIVVRTFCRMNHLGLLLTTHTPAIGVPVLFRTEPSVESLRLLLEFLLEDDAVPEDSELETLLKNFKYDVREILFSLYDAYEKFRLAPRELREKLVRKYPR